MDAPDLRWHDRSTADSERYEWSAWPTIRAVVTRLTHRHLGADYHAVFELYGRATPAPRPFTARGAQESGLAHHRTSPPLGVEYNG